jgi:hypothetical protein
MSCWKRQPVEPGTTLFANEPARKHVCWFEQSVSRVEPFRMELAAVVI